MAIEYDPPAPAATIVTQPTGVGPSIGTTGGYDPITGDRYTSQFRYTPVNPQDELMRQAFIQSQQAFYPPPPQPQGPTPYWENPATYYPRQEQPDPVAQAKAATSAAYKYIAFRGYQQDLKEGKSAADAFAKWGPMLVQDVSLAPMTKALQRPAPYVFNPQTRAYESSSGGRPYFEPSTLSRMPDVAVEQNIKTIDGQQFYHNPRTGSITKLDSGNKPAELDVIDYRHAQSQLADANKVLMDQYSTPQARAAATNVINEASATIKGVRGAKQPTAPAAPTTIKKFKWNRETGKFE